MRFRDGRPHRTAYSIAHRDRRRAEVAVELGRLEEALTSALEAVQRLGELVVAPAHAGAAPSREHDEPARPPTSNEELSVCTPTAEVAGSGRARPPGQGVTASGRSNNGRARHPQMDLVSATCDSTAT